MFKALGAIISAIESITKNCVEKYLAKKENKMKNVLFYYGWVNSFNSAQNQWTNELVAQDMAKYGMIVLGNGVADPTHGDYANACIVIARIKELNPSAKIFGYVTSNQVFADFCTKVDQWNALSVYGIFMDEAGYDYGKTRLEFNQRVDYVHSRSKSKVAFANAWNPDHVLGLAEDVSFPNATFNPTSHASHLIESDLVLLENFGILNSAYESSSQWFARGTKAKSLHNQFGVPFVAVSVISNTDANAQAKFNFGYISADMFSLFAYGSSDDYYGANSATVACWVRPDDNNISLISEFEPAVIQAGTKYFRYCERGYLTLDFASGSEYGVITEF